MRSLMTITAIMLLSAGIVAANTIHSIDKFAPQKDDFGGSAERGMLDCSNAIEVDISSGFWTESNTNVGAPNNVTTYGCSSWNEAGGEVVYRVVFPDGVTWEVGITPSGCDLDLAVLDMCDEDLGCIMVVDSGVFVSEPVPGEFFFVVDGYAGAECGYTITFETAPYEEPEPVSFCDMVQVVEGTGSFTGNTCDGQNLIFSFPCIPFTENGLEHYYEVFMPAGSSFTADLNHSVDSALWILDACVEPMTCLAGADNEVSGFETISYTNAGEDTVVYLVVDSYGTSTCGEYTLDFSSEGGAVATRVESLSGVKTLFR
jgi:hypothetical protein